MLLPKHILIVLRRPHQSLVHTMRTVTTSKIDQQIFNIKSEKDFEMKVMGSSKPVIVDFFANWCIPCKKLTPIIENIVAEKAGAIQLAKVNIDDLEDLALNYNISSVPELIMMKGGRVTDRLVGLQNSEILRKWINEATDDKKEGIRRKEIRQKNKYAA